MANARKKPDVLYGTGQYVIERDAALGIEVTFLPPWFRCRGEPDRTVTVRFEPGREADAFERRLDEALEAERGVGIYRVAVSAMLAAHVPEAEPEDEPSAPAF